MAEFAEFLSSPLASIVFLLALTATLIAVGVYVIGKFRADIHDREPESSELLTDFQEMHEQGDLEDDEFRSIKAKLSERLQRELRERELKRANKSE